MDESDSDAGSSDADSDGGVLFPLEGKYRNTKDKAQIMALPEMQREEILAERAHQVAEKKKLQELQQLIAAKDREATKGRKRGAAAADLDDSPRSSRVRSKKDEALDELVRRRQSRKDTGRRTDRAPRRRADSIDSAASSFDADGDSDDGARRKPAVDAVGELADFQRVRVGRTNFPQICFWPTFESVIKGCFARVVYSQDSSGQNVYRMCQITGKFPPRRPKRSVISHRKVYLRANHIV